MTPLALLLALTFLVSVDVRILTAVLPSIAVSLGSSPGAVGLAMTSYTLAYGTGQLVYGPISDRLGRIPVVRAAGLGFSLSTVASALAFTAPQFIAARLVVGAFAGAVIPLALVFIGDTVEYNRRQVVIGRFAVVTSAALAFSASVGGLVTHLVSWRVMLTGYGLLALIPVGLMWRLETQRPMEAAEAPGRYRDFLGNRRAQSVYVGVFLEGFLLWGAATYLGAFGTTRHGFDQLTVGLLVALFGFGIMIGGILMGSIRRRLSENALAALGGILMGVALLLLVPRWSWVAFAASMPLLGLGCVGLHSTLQLRGTEIGGPAGRGKAFSLFAFNLFAGIAAGTATLGRLVDAGNYEALFLIASLGLIVVGIVTALSPPRPSG